MTKRTRARQHTTARDYPRTARLNQLFHEILAEELERIDDDRLELVTVMSVDCESDLRHATVYYDTLGGEDDDEEVLEALGEHRHAPPGRHRPPGPREAHAGAGLQARRRWAAARRASKRSSARSTTRTS